MGAVDLRKFFILLLVSKLQFWVEKKMGTYSVTYFLLSSLSALEES